MSDRLRTDSIRQLFSDVERFYQHQWPESWCYWIDGLPLPVGGSTQDRQARYGRAAGVMAKGYKFHGIVQAGGGAILWRIAPLNVNEQTMAKRMLRDLPMRSGYLVGDGEYDADAIHRWAEQRALHSLAPRRKGTNLGHVRQSAARLHSVRLLDGAFGQNLLRGRSGIDRFLGHWHSCPVGLKPLPAWVRGLRRVRQRVGAKLLCFYAWRRARTQLVA